MRAEHELGNEMDQLETKYKKKVCLNITIKGIIKALTLCFPFGFYGLIYSFDPLKILRHVTWFTYDLWLSRLAHNECKFHIHLEIKGDRFFVISIRDDVKHANQADNIDSWLNKFMILRI